MGNDRSEFVTYRVVETMLARHVPSQGERVIITALDTAGDVLTWSAQPGRVPRLGAVIEVNMRYPEDPPAEDATPAPPAPRDPGRKTRSGS